MLRIRLTRTGKKHQPTYRIVVAEHTRPIKGKFVEILGYYIPTQKPKVLEVNTERAKYWISQGAQASDTVHNLLADKGVLTAKRSIRYARVVEKVEKEAKPTPAAEPVAEEVPTEEVITVETDSDQQPTEPVEETPTEEAPAEEVQA